jgi:hypothetical protein
MGFRRLLCQLSENDWHRYASETLLPSIGTTHEHLTQKLRFPRSPKITAVSLALNPGSTTWRSGVTWNHDSTSAS